MCSVVEEIENRKLKWDCKFIRINNERKTKQVFERRRRLGRLRKKWE